ncbi:flavodoxin family protein [Caldicellulosiruptor changbaiensis]|uniref:Flavodoxin family protein n=1 Tax=Caldicellulosiruptor changbaiensis TaxID=1222016 RepID=A0A3T0D7W9_9FIRM|nr:flavodoxin family protein [Caldicellulosiruptor changbaiensis]AZT91230.1 flavodoxin family protein [Caldicellulosiruptor changbaiensis]
MKVFIFNGSPKGNDSFSLYVAKKLLTNMESILNTKFEINVFDTNKFRINQCKGCLTCFKQGKCLLDEKDDMLLIKNAMEISDIIIIATPVYAANVSAQTKVFIDRISYWLHLFKLLGKIGIPIVTASSNSLIEVTFYLKRIMLALGLNVFETIAYTRDYPNVVDDETNFEEEIFQKAQKLCEYLENPMKIKVHPLQEDYFKTLKDNLMLREVEDAEVNYWRENGYFEFDNYESLLLHFLKNKNS